MRAVARQPLKFEPGTKGRVKIEVYASQTLLKGPDIWRGVSTGIADMADRVIHLSNGHISEIKANAEKKPAHALFW